MKRSEINAIIQSADAFIRAQGFYLPPFAYWKPQDWQQKGNEVREIVENALGWDITDFGIGEFSKFGLFLFTLRNGSPENLASRTGKLYAEKIMVVEDGQTTPLHFHWHKMEDIINRGGGKLKLRLYPASANEDLVRTGEVHFSVDGSRHRIDAGEVVTLEPGESITLEQHCYHEFWGDGRVLVGEVSMVNDDNHDNRFFQSIGRFPTIVEDEAPLYLLVSDYDKYYQKKVV
ncbi:MAG: D-lyxose/D-mannose family sugar isomerase [Chloroflexi bacterium]|nr:D-lyxose/D-mannose family sugar isomerase [Chloroflexota bacterium]